MSSSQVRHPGEVKWGRRRMRAAQHEDNLAGTRVIWRRWPRPGAARSVLALHCSLSHSGEWSGLAGARPELEFSAPDLTGHGRMPPWVPGADHHAQATALARALAERLVREAGGPVDLIGHSFGGTVALRLALDRPDLFRRIVLVEPVIFAAARGSAAWPRQLREHDQLEAIWQADGARPAMEAFLSVWGATGPAAMMSHAQEAYMLDRIGFVMELDDVLMTDPMGLLSPGRLEALDRPVLLVEGAESPPVIAAIHDHLAPRLPNTARVAVPGAAHMIPVTHAPALARLVGEFLA